MTTKICTKCHQIKDEQEFSWKNQEKGWCHSFCRECQAAYRRAHYLKNRTKYLRKARQWNGKQTKILRQFIVNYLKIHPCVDCGIADIRVLDFDHEGKKLMGVAQMIRNCHSVDSIKQEIAKCSVRCANCHRVKTFIQGKFWKIKMGP